MSTVIPKPYSHFISWSQAQIMIGLYQANRESILAPEYQGRDILAFSELFNVTAFVALVNVPGCAAIRIYYGMDDNLLVHAILVAVDSQGNDIVSSGNPAATFESGGNPPVVEEGQRCPPNC
jgi:hypothetical protein